MKKYTIPLLLTLALLTACTPSANLIETAIAQTQAAQPTNTADPTYTPYPISTAYPTYTPPPTFTPFPTASPLASPTAFVVTATFPPPTSLNQITGQGNVVTDNFNWGGCTKAVFAWIADGKDNMIVYLYKIGVEDSRLLVNEIGPGTGEVLQPLLGGTYYLTIQGPSEGWSINVECQD